MCCLVYVLNWSLVCCLLDYFVWVLIVLGCWVLLVMFACFCCLYCELVMWVVLLFGFEIACFELIVGVLAFRFVSLVGN